MKIFFYTKYGVDCIVIKAASDTVIVADHHNSMKMISMLLQEVCDSNCYFTSFNTQVQYMIAIT